MEDSINWINQKIGYYGGALLVVLPFFLFKFCLIDSCCKQNFVVGEGEIKSPPERKLLPVLEVPVPETHQAYKYHIICKGVVVQYSKDP